MSVTISIPFYLPLHFNGMEEGGAQQTIYSAIPAGKETVSIEFIGADMEEAIKADPLGDVSLMFHVIGESDERNDISITVNSGEKSYCASISGKAVEITLGNSVGTLIGSGTMLLKFV